jgi:hypothetical protein
MKRIMWPLLLTMMLAVALAACGGGAAEPAAPVEEAAEVVEEAAEEAVEPVAEAPPEEATEAPADEAAEAPAEEPAEAPAEAAEEAPAEEGAAVLVAGLPASGIDADSGLEINPLEVQPGVDYIVRGELVNFALVPTDKPEFMIQSPDGTRYRVRSQPVEEIAFTDGSTLLPHEYKRGMLAQATARLMESATATSVMLSTDLVLLPSE